MEGFLGKEIVPVMENAPSGNELNNHINLLTGLKFSLFKDKEVSSVYVSSMCMCRSMFCPEDLKKRNIQGGHILCKNRGLCSLSQKE